MTKEFIDYEQALELKELGFNEECIVFFAQSHRYSVLEQNGYGWETITNGKLKKYKKACAVPLYQQAFRWFREKHGLTSWIEKQKDFDKKYSWYIITDEDSDNEYLAYELHIEKHKEAELSCLRKLIEIVLSKPKPTSKVIFVSEPTFQFDVKNPTTGNIEKLLKLVENHKRTIQDLEKYYPDHTIFVFENPINPTPGYLRAYVHDDKLYGCPIRESITTNS